MFLVHLTDIISAKKIISDGYLKSTEEILASGERRWCDTFTPREFYKTGMEFVRGGSGNQFPGIYFHRLTNEFQYQNVYKDEEYDGESYVQLVFSGKILEDRKDWHGINGRLGRPEKRDSGVFDFVNAFTYSYCPIDFFSKPYHEIVFHSRVPTDYLLATFFDHQDDYFDIGECQTFTEFPKYGRLSLIERTIEEKEIKPQFWSGLSPVERIIIPKEKYYRDRFVPYFRSLRFETR